MVINKYFTGIEDIWNDNSELIMEIWNETTDKSISISPANWREDFIQFTVIHLECVEEFFKDTISSDPLEISLYGTLLLVFSLYVESIADIIYNDPQGYHCNTSRDFLKLMTKKWDNMSKLDISSNYEGTAPWMDAMETEWTEIAEFLHLNSGIQVLVMGIISICGGWPDLMEVWFLNPHVGEIVTNAYKSSLLTPYRPKLFGYADEIGNLLSNRPYLLERERYRKLHDILITPWRYDYPVRYYPLAENKFVWIYPDLNSLPLERKGNFFKTVSRR